MIDKLCLGTWQLEQRSPEIYNELLEFAINKGIRKFDTALVYGNGLAEKQLSVLGKNKYIITKIPGKKKPQLNEKESISEFYTLDWVKHCLDKSINNLECYPDVILLHNWVQDWENKNEIFEIFDYLKNVKGIKEIGISLPDNFDCKISSNILSTINFLEVPYNKNNKWLEKYHYLYKQFNIKIATRSLLLHGEIKDSEEIFNIINRADRISDIIILGMSKFETINRNIEIFGKINSF